MFPDFTKKCILHAVAWISIVFVHFTDSAIALTLYKILMYATIVLLSGRLLYINNCVIYDDSKDCKIPPLHWNIIGIFIETVVFVTILEAKGYTWTSALTIINAFIGLAIVYQIHKEVKGSVAVWEYHLKHPRPY